MTIDPAIDTRRRELVREAGVTLKAIRLLAHPETTNPLMDPETLARAVTSGILDAPHLANNLFARGLVVARIDARGACVAVDPHSGQPLSEQERLARLGIDVQQDGSQGVAWYCDRWPVTEQSMTDYERKMNE
jgi:hypothetical protein